MSLRWGGGGTGPCDCAQGDRHAGGAALRGGGGTGPCDCAQGDRHAGGAALREAGTGPCDCAQGDGVSCDCAQGAPIPLRRGIGI